MEPPRLLDPGRGTVPRGVREYADLRDELDALSGRINARHSSVDWTPLRYINRSLSQWRLAALYRLSRIGLVTPLADGMNLVAKEYVAAQDPADPGVLILSRSAGAADQLGSALMVNPRDFGAVASAIRQALEMPLEERRCRWATAMVGSRADDIHDWRERFFEALRQSDEIGRFAVPNQQDRGAPTEWPARTARLAGQASRSPAGRLDETGGGARRPAVSVARAPSGLGLPAAGHVPSGSSLNTL